MRTHQWLLLPAAWLGMAGNAVALQVEGPETETGSWTQFFTEFGSGTFDHIQMRTLSGDGFVVSLQGIQSFSDGAWCQSYNDGALLTADGPALSFLGFSLHFEGALADPLSFDYQIWNGAVLQESLLVQWNGSSFSIGPSAWSDDRIDQGQNEFTGVFDVAQTGILPGCMAEAVYTVSMGQLCGNGPAAAPDYFHYTVFVDYPANLQPVAVEQLFFPPFGHTFQTGPLSGGQLEVSLSIFGHVTNSTGPLFRVGFAALADVPPNEVSIADVILRKPVNVDLVAFFGPADGILVDAVLPAITLEEVPPGTCHTDAGFPVELSATDPGGLSLIEERLDGGPWSDTGLPVSGTSFGPAVHYVDLTGVPDGSHTVEFRSVDAFCNGSAPVSWTFLVDNSPPLPVATLEANPRDHGVLLTWSNTGGQDGYTLFRHRRPGYPYFGGAALQGTPAEFVATLGAGITTYLDDTGSDGFASRAAYDYRLDAYDCANGAVTGSSIASATNYFLGDWAGYDGAVCAPELADLSLYYNTVPAPGLGDELDVGPTDDGTSFGLPLPDAWIGFEDLVVFALNYRVGCASPLTARPGIVVGKGVELPVAALLQPEQRGDRLYLELPEGVMAASLRFRCESRVRSLVAGSALVFTRECPGGFVIDLAWAASDGNTSGSLEIGLDSEAVATLVEADCRTASNGRLAFDPPTGSRGLPLTTALLPSVPNPFNPSTRVKFVLDRATTVELSVYNLQGARVWSLASGTLPEGEHSVLFEAGNLASGAYLLRLQTGDQVDTGKLLLMR